MALGSSGSDFISCAEAVELSTVTLPLPSSAAESCLEKRSCSRADILGGNSPAIGHDEIKSYPASPIHSNVVVAKSSNL